MHKGSARDQVSDAVTDSTDLENRRTAARADVAKRIAAARALAQRLTEERSAAAATAARGLAADAISDENQPHSE